MKRAFVCIALFAAFTGAASAGAATPPLIRAGDLPGWKQQETGAWQGPTAFAKAHEKSPAKLVAAGFVKGAGVSLVGPPGGFGVSIVQQYGTAGQARSEAARLVRVNLRSGDGLAARPLAISAVPGARAVILTGSRDGKRYAGAGLVWLRGTFVGELFFLAPDVTVRASDVRAAARRLYQRAR